MEGVFTRGLVCFAALLVFPVQQAAAQQELDRNLRSGEMEVRIDAIKRLSLSSKKSALRSLARALREDKSVKVRMVAARGVARMGDRNQRLSKRAQGHLRRAAKNDSSRRLRKLARELSTDKLIHIFVRRSRDKSRRVPKDVLREVERVFSRVLKNEMNGVEVRFRGKPIRTNKEDLWFTLNSEVSQLRIERAEGKTRDLRCSVRVTLQPKDKSNSGRELIGRKGSAVASGTGLVPGLRRRSQVGDATRECVTEVAEELVSGKIAEFLRSLK